jgi:hypothetical protein
VTAALAPHDQQLAVAVQEEQQQGCETCVEAAPLPEAAAADGQGQQLPEEEEEAMEQQQEKPDVQPLQQPVPTADASVQSAAVPPVHEQSGCVSGP